MSARKSVRKNSPNASSAKKRACSQEKAQGFKLKVIPSKAIEDFDIDAAMQHEGQRRVNQPMSQNGYEKESLVYDTYNSKVSTADTYQES